MATKRKILLTPYNQDELPLSKRKILVDPDVLFMSRLQAEPNILVRVGKRHKQMLEFNERYRTDSNERLSDQGTTYGDDGGEDAQQKLRVRCRSRNQQPLQSSSKMSLTQSRRVPSSGMSDRLGLNTNATTSVMPSLVDTPGNRGRGAGKGASFVSVSDIYQTSNSVVPPATNEQRLRLRLQQNMAKVTELWDQRRSQFSQSSVDSHGRNRRPQLLLRSHQQQCASTDLRGTSDALEQQDKVSPPRNNNKSSIST